MRACETTTDICAVHMHPRGDNDGEAYRVISMALVSLLERRLPAPPPPPSAPPKITSLWSTGRSGEESGDSVTSPAGSVGTAR